MFHAQCLCKRSFKALGHIDLQSPRNDFLNIFETIRTDDPRKHGWQTALRLFDTPLSKVAVPNFQQLFQSLCHLVDPFFLSGAYASSDLGFRENVVDHISFENIRFWSKVKRKS